MLTAEDLAAVCAIVRQELQNLVVAVAELEKSGDSDIVAAYAMRCMETDDGSNMQQVR